MPAGTVNGAVVRIDYSLQQVDQAIATILRDSIIANAIIMLLGILLLIFYMHRNLTRGIREADLFADAIAQQDFEAEIPFVRKDNLGRLMFKLIRMRDALVEQFNEIQHAHEHKRLKMDAQLALQQKETKLVVAFEAGIVKA